eukprot:GEMP01046075.1.p1 GENE.GEMP01046075.1~~GEMP01046075.1.p1  ORF type:complete len:430 (+),score=104.23 GEMP01046075.1:172-1461(+)
MTYILCLTLMLLSLMLSLHGCQSQNLDEQTMAPPITLVWYAPFLSGGGFANEATNIVLGLAPILKQNLIIRQFAEHRDDAFVQGLPADVRNVLFKHLARPLPTDRRYIVVCHATPDVMWKDGAFGWGKHPNACPPSDDRNLQMSIVRSMYEKTALPVEWAERINRFDRVWVPTHFGRQLFEDHGVSTPIDIVPEPVASVFFNDATKPLTQVEGIDLSRPFLAVGKFEKRKGFEILIEAFFTAQFPADVKVQLVIKTSSFYSDLADLDALIRSYNDTATKNRRVHVITDHLSTKKLARLYKAARALVQPSRGEGWGLPIAEAMATGVVAIATNWSGPTAYLRADNGLPLRVKKMVDIDADDPEGGKWAEPDVDHLRELLAWVVEHPDEAHRLGAEGRNTMVKDYTPQRVAEHIVDLLIRVSGDTEKSEEL